jgi:uncharacterized membrane protein HdeD (DUF308 family)
LDFALVVAFGIDVMSFPIHTTQFLILLDALALLFNGIARIVQGIIDKDMSRWSRGFLVGVGAMSIALSALVVIHPLTIGVTLLALHFNCTSNKWDTNNSSGSRGKQRYAKSRVSK